MTPVLKGGLLLGALCGGWIFMNGLLGWYKHPTMHLTFIPIVSAMEIGVLIWALRKTAAQGRTYSGQVVAGTLIALIGAVIIVAASMIFSTVLYPDFFDEINAMSREMMAKAGRSEEEIAAAIDAAKPGQTPIRAAMGGFIGTMVTGIVASAVIAIWIRARESRTGGAALRASR